MDSKIKMPENDWTVPDMVTGDVDSIAGGDHRSLLVFEGGLSATHAEPTQVVRAGENRLVIACSAFAMYCINLVTGEILWTIREHKGGDPESDFKQTVYHNGVIYCGINNISFSAIDPATGQYLWQVSCGKKMSSFCVPFVFKDNKVYVSNEDTVFCIDLDTHKLVWKTPVSDKKTIYERTPFLWDKYIVYHAKSYQKKITPDSFQFLYFNTVTGVSERKENIASLPDYSVTPVFADDRLWYIDNEDMISCYDPKTGKEDKAVPDYPPLKNAGEWKYYYRGDCFFLHGGKIYASLNFKIDDKSEFGMYSYDIATQKLEYVFDLVPAKGRYILDWWQRGDYLYGKNESDSDFLYRLSLTTLKVEKFKHGLTGSMLRNEGKISIDRFAGIHIAEGVIYLTNRFAVNKFGKDEAGYICLTAIW